MGSDLRLMISLGSSSMEDEDEFSEEGTRSVFLLLALQISHENEEGGGGGEQAEEETGPSLEHLLELSAEEQSGEIVSPSSSSSSSFSVESSSSTSKCLSPMYSLGAEIRLLLQPKSFPIRKIGEIQNCRCTFTRFTSRSAT